MMNMVFVAFLCGIAAAVGFAAVGAVLWWRLSSALHERAASPSADASPPPDLKARKSPRSPPPAPPLSVGPDASSEAGSTLQPQRPSSPASVGASAARRVRRRSATDGSTDESLLARVSGHQGLSITGVDSLGPGRLSLTQGDGDESASQGKASPSFPALASPLPDLRGHESRSRAADERQREAPVQPEDGAQGGEAAGCPDPESSERCSAGDGTCPEPRASTPASLPPAPAALVDDEDPRAAALTVVQDAIGKTSERHALPPPVPALSQTRPPAPPAVAPDWRVPADGISGSTDDAWGTSGGAPRKLDPRAAPFEVDLALGHAADSSPMSLDLGIDVPVASKGFSAAPVQPASVPDPGSGARLGPSSAMLQLGSRQTALDSTIWSLGAPQASSKPAAPPAPAPAKPDASGSQAAGPAAAPAAPAAFETGPFDREIGVVRWVNGSAHGHILRNLRSLSERPSGPRPPGKAGAIFFTGTDVSHNIQLQRSDVVEYSVQPGQVGGKGNRSKPRAVGIVLLERGGAPVGLGMSPESGDIPWQRPRRGSHRRNSLPSTGFDSSAQMMSARWGDDEPAPELLSAMARGQPAPGPSAWYPPHLHRHLQQSAASGGNVHPGYFGFPGQPHPQYHHMPPRQGYPDPSSVPGYGPRPDRMGHPGLRAAHAGHPSHQPPSTASLGGHPFHVAKAIARAAAAATVSAWHDAGSRQPPYGHAQPFGHSTGPGTSTGAAPTSRVDSRPAASANPRHVARGPSAGSDLDPLPSPTLPPRSAPQLPEPLAVLPPVSSPPPAAAAAAEAAPAAEAPAVPAPPAASTQGPSLQSSAEGALAARSLAHAAAPPASAPDEPSAATSAPESGSAGPTAASAAATAAAPAPAAVATAAATPAPEQPPHPAAPAASDLPPPDLAPSARSRAGSHWRRNSFPDLLMAASIADPSDEDVATLRTLREAGYGYEYAGDHVGASELDAQTGPGASTAAFGTLRHRVMASAAGLGSPALASEAPEPLPRRPRVGSSVASRGSMASSGPHRARAELGIAQPARRPSGLRSEATSAYSGSPIHSPPGSPLSPTPQTLREIRGRRSQQEGAPRAPEPLPSVETSAEKAGAVADSGGAGDKGAGAQAAPLEAAGPAPASLPRPQLGSSQRAPTLAAGPPVAPRSGAAKQPSASSAGTAPSWRSEGGAPAAAGAPSAQGPQPGAGANSRRHPKPGVYVPPGARQAALAAPPDAAGPASAAASSGRSRRLRISARQSSKQKSPSITAAAADLLDGGLFTP